MTWQRARICACGCGEWFAPYRPNHIYLEGHRPAVERERSTPVRLTKAEIAALRSILRRIDG
jgi:hypothetical protein